MEEDLRPGTEQYRFIEQCHIGLMKFHNHSGFYKDFSSWLYIVFLVFFLKNEAFSFYRRRRRWQQALPYSNLCDHRAYLAELITEITGGINELADVAQFF